jgi:hypothetical protein
VVASLGIEKLLKISENQLLCDGRQLESTKEEGAAAREANFEDWNWFFLFVWVQGRFLMESLVMLKKVKKTGRIS